MESEDLLSRISEVHPNQVWLDKEKVEKRLRPYNCVKVKHQKSH